MSTPRRRRSHSPCLQFVISILALAAVALTTACGSGSMSTPSSPVLSGNTQVTLVLSGTANDQLTEFDLGLQGISLTSQSGKMVSVLSALQRTEFIHINGGIEPLVTVNIPQDVYTAATVTVAGAGFTCLDFTAPDTLDSSTFAYGQTPSANVTVNLSAPITITGDAMGLSLNLLVAQSATYSACYDPNAISTYSITPTFNLAPMAFSSEPTSPENGKANGFNGQVSSIDAANNSFTVALPMTENTRTVSIASVSSTTYQGIDNFSALAVGTFVTVDGAIQPNGSLVAMRIAVEDTTALQMMTGPLMQVSAGEPALVLWGRQQQGTGEDVGGGQYFSFGNAAFRISGQLANLQNLPFTPAFSSSNMVPGQNVYVSASTLVTSGGFPYTPASTVTLIAQTIDGAVVASSNSGGFTTYTVDLASYDLFPMLAVQPGQAALLTNPGEVEVYVDNNTQQLNSQPLAPGSTLRFYGLVFNDNGTLRMDCAQVNDGVAETPQSNASQQNLPEKGQAKAVRVRNFGRLR
ncbi:MAG TPA: DUF5666 domain-containing protein [Candidatus Polarisedimenticolia bacterium]|nr:DUF5666 domain-containing protein [Candidatus Polarisedimenticolia bacterium]